MSAKRAVASLDESEKRFEKPLNSARMMRCDVHWKCRIARNAIQ